VARPDRHLRPLRHGRARGRGGESGGLGGRVAGDGRVARVRGNLVPRVATDRVGKPRALHRRGARV
ncbi:MAG: hypothetical protein AVDCRST_MAG70-2137, partial [uncultured Thermomicrobiales bacterium]